MSVSIIIPNYNNAEFLPACLDSCLRQGNVVYEIIVVDDHSTDNSWQVLELYKNRYPELFKLFKNQGKGACAARNFGFQQSSGAYIQFLDADDILGPSKIATQLVSLKQTNSEVIASCSWQFFTDQPEGFGYKKQQLMNRSYNDPNDWLVDSWMGGGMGAVHSWLTPRGIIEEVGEWNESLLKNQDGEYFFRVLLEAKRIKFVGNIKVYYRKPNKNNISRRKSLESMHSLLETYKIYERILDQKDNITVRKALARNYASFIFYIYPDYKGLQNEAFGRIIKLGFNRPPLISGSRFQLLQKTFGFKNALWIKSLMNQ